MLGDVFGIFQFSTAKWLGLTVHYKDIFYSKLPKNQTRDFLNWEPRLTNKVTTLPRLI